MKIQKWEYIVAYINLANNANLVKRLNELGNEGWELIMKKDEYGIFKRLVK